MKLAYPIATPEVKSRILGCSLPVEEACAALREAGYAGVEPFVCDPSRFDGEAWIAAVRRHGLAIAAVGTGPTVFDDGLSFTAPEAARRRAAIDRAKAIVAFAAHCGAQVNIGKLRGDVRQDPSGAAPQHLREAFLEISACAAQLGTTVTLEPQNRAIIDNLNTTDEALAWVRDVGAANVGLLLDLYHMHQEREDLPASLHRARDVLWHVHFADTDRAMPGRGTIDFASVVARLRALAYDRFITVEAKQEPDSLTAARAAAAFLLPLLSVPCASA